ncbi:MAG: hypothetical protein H5U07_03505 [Candidatus Aminicenantes bacterium]|nr:hypothetical protein [Candidatus Aminicenantes bacterium]
MGLAKEEGWENFPPQNEKKLLEDKTENEKIIALPVGARVGICGTSGIFRISKISCASGAVATYHRRNHLSQTDIHRPAFSAAFDSPNFFQTSFSVNPGATVIRSTNFRNLWSNWFCFVPGGWMLVDKQI